MRLKDAYLRDIPNITQLFDYGTRTDGQPAYLGKANNGTSEATGTWLIHFFEFNASGFITTITSKEGTWAGRVALFA